MEVLTEGEWVSGDYGDFFDLSPEERAIVERRAEQVRLEREVIEAAKAEYRADERYRWRQARRKAVKDLIEFESNQKG